MKKQPNETSNNVRSISDCLVKVIAGTGRVNFFKFIINPKSFSQTVENLFYLSFLIKDGKVSFLVDDVTSEPFLSIYKKLWAVNLVFSLNRYTGRKAR